METAIWGLGFYIGVYWDSGKYNRNYHLGMILEFPTYSAPLFAVSFSSKP